MELSARVEYALAALLDMASHANAKEPIQIKLIAARQEIPDRYLEHIFHALRRAGIVYSQRGMKGGYFLAKAPQKITLLEVFECFEDSKQLKPIEASISMNRSIVRDTWQGIYQNAREVLQQMTLQDLSQQRSEREQFNGMYY